MIIKPNDPLITSLSLNTVTGYLLSNNWKKTKSKENKLDIFEGPKADDAQPIELALPGKEDFFDLRIRLAESINLLAELNGMSPQEIISEIRSSKPWPAHDILKVRIMNHFADNGSIHLLQASEFITELMKLICISASTEKYPRQYLKKTPPFKNYADQFRFGQTFAGSFGFTVQYPDIHSDDSLPPFQRRVFTRIIRGLQHTMDAVNSKNINKITENYDIGLNANMCEALAALGGEKQDTEIEFRVSWSNNWQPPDDLGKIAPIQIDHTDYCILRQAAKKLSKMEHPDDIKEIKGKITNLYAEATMDPSSERKVNIRHKLNSGKKDSKKIMNVRIYLQPNDYRTACDAHRDGKTVSVEGTLKKPRHFWELTSPFNFKVIKN